jgi:pilus assembly protein CpaE
MKIKVISPLRERADVLAKSVSDAAPGSEVLAAQSVGGELLTAVNGSRPQLLVIDEVDGTTLDALTRLSALHPEVDSIIISREQSPEFLLAAMKAGVRDVLPSPVDPLSLTAAVQRIARKRSSVAPVVPGKQGKVFAFMSCKGGNGASFLAANLAHVLAHRGEQTVGLLDLDLQYGDCLLMLTDQRAKSDVAEVADQINRIDASLLQAAMVQVSPQLWVLAAPADLSQALGITAQHVETIVRQARQMFDYVVIDVSRSIDAVTLKALDMADMIFPVVQLNLPNVRDAKRLRTLFRSLEYPMHKLSWVVNRYQKTSEITLESFEQTLGVKDSILIPNHHQSVSASVNQGVAIEKAGRANPVAKALQNMAQTVAPVEAQRKEGWLASMFRTH